MKIRTISAIVSRQRRMTTACVALASVGAIVATQFGASVAASAAGTQYPVTSTLTAAFNASLINPAASPAGVNVAGCVPSAAHPRPVVLIQGTFANMVDAWSGIGPTLANMGYCVYSTPFGGSPDRPVQSIGPVATSAQTIATFIDKVLTQTHTQKVDLIGWSQGGLIAEYYAKVLGGAGKVGNLIGLSPTTHGTNLDGLASLAAVFPGVGGSVSASCHACMDQTQGSAVIQAVDNGPIAQPGVKYTIIETRDEYVVTPVGSSFINEPGVTNEWLQNSCPMHITGHVGLTYDRAIWGLVTNALDPAHAQAVTC